jgi:hypothetical protein
MATQSVRQSVDNELDRIAAHAEWKYEQATTAKHQRGLHALYADPACWMCDEQEETATREQFEEEMARQHDAGQHLPKIDDCWMCVRNFEAEYWQLGGTS